MTKREFESEIRRLMRRAELLRQAATGSVKLRPIAIPACRVVEHTRGAHTRLIAPRGWKSSSGKGE